MPVMISSKFFKIIHITQLRLSKNIEKKIGNENDIEKITEKYIGKKITVGNEWIISVK